MFVVKATKRFRQVTLFMSLIFSITSIVICAVPQKDCTGINLRAAVGLLSALWVTLFILLLLQVIGYTKCIKEYPKSMFVYYFVVSGIMFAVQMMCFSGVQGEKNNCMKEVPLQYWYCVTNITIFYGMVTFGLATWGFYLCKVADAREELVNTAVNDHLKR